jgi:hypothetical protein
MAAASLLSFGGSNISHNPEKAGQIALSFSEQAFVNRDYEAAMKFLPEERDPSIPTITWKSPERLSHIPTATATRYIK